MVTVQADLDRGLMVLGRRVDSLALALVMGDLQTAQFVCQQIESTALKLAGKRGRHYDAGVSS